MDNEKSIVFYTGNLHAGGAERVISILANKLVSDGRSVKILLFFDDEIFYEFDPSVEIVSIEKETRSRNIIRNTMWMRKFFRENADIVISFLATFNMLAIVSLAGTNIPLIVADRNDPRYVPSNSVLRKGRDFLYRFAKRVVVQTSHNKAYFSPAIQKKTTIIFNPVEMHEKMGLGLRVEKTKEIVTVGRLMPQKNQEMLIEAFSEISEKYPDYRLTIYGEGPYRKTLEERILQLNLQNKVFLPGTEKDIHNKIASAEVFVLPSNYEGMPNALIEAMCLGLPVVSAKVSGATDLVKDGINGLLINVGAKEELECAIEKLIEDKEMRVRIATEALEINNLLNLSDIVQQWITTIETCC